MSTQAIQQIAPSTGHVNDTSRIQLLNLLSHRSSNLKAAISCQDLNEELSRIAESLHATQRAFPVRMREIEQELEGSLAEAKQEYEQFLAKAEHDYREILAEANTLHHKSIDKAKSDRSIALVRAESERNRQIDHAVHKLRVTSSSDDFSSAMIRGIAFGISAGLVAGIISTQTSQSFRDMFSAGFLVAWLVTIVVFFIRQSKEEKLLHRNEDEFSRIKREAITQYNNQVKEEDTMYHQVVNTLESQHIHRIAESEADYQRTISTLDSSYAETSSQMSTNGRNAIEDCKNQHQQRLSTISSQIDVYITRTESEVVSFDYTGDEWAPVSSVAGYAQIGKIDIVTDENRPMPVVIRIPDQMSLLFHAQGAQQAHISEAILLRYLTAFPAGKLEFTLVDPVGLGRNVSALMHLHDHYPQLINDRAWIEPQHIEKQLAELSETIQNIIQKYLRTTYATMEEYNTAAGEVAEPYRVLVVNNFPANFSSEALRHLVSIVQNGPKCGVYTVIAVDDSQELPYKFNLADLEQGCTAFRPREAGRSDSGWSMSVPGVHWWPYFPEKMPSAKVTQHLLDVVGKNATESSIVQVPFTGLAPNRDVWWTNSSRDGLYAPIGVTGARKPQLLSIGQGMANTALIVGRVGSGKSTLMHAAIMNLALTYNPEELELYLLDFKKGVEFKTYAVHKLPHAQAIAVESEREFALSVLQRLDRELTERGELFRGVTEKHGEAPNIQSYREKTGCTLPRVLLIVDEFQEFFTESDALASQAELLLDRLVRQGRAFGIHVMLGTQTLAGSYGMAKSTLNQIPIRIALQCSEADSRLVLSDDNPAARLLNRPGEAIYNDENGRIEGNTLFQTAWLTDDDRDAYLDQLAAMAAEKFPDLPEPIVFEGNATADPARNRQLATILAANSRMTKTPLVQAWVGDPIAITDPAAASLRDQAGANLLVIGQDEEASYGILATSVIGIARQHEVTGDQATITVVDMSAADHPYANLFSDIGAMFPERITIAGRRQAIPVVERTYQELERRMAADESGSSSFDRLYVIIVGLPRVRDLREDDSGGFGGGFFGEEQPSKTPNQMFHAILKEGPEFGIHVIAWADTFNNFSRVVDRRGLREFDLRVAMQMSGDDSNVLVDSPAASRLGPNRALLYSEEKGTSLKFRPYGVPSQEWIEQIRNRPTVNSQG